ncbi:MAG: ABC transporter substrate-binding protein [Oceanospirillaceae bacterium]|nr:ABC transporter substrate-binding protein [Oceanospirillaceae bacterium]
MLNLRIKSIKYTLILIALLAFSYKSIASDRKFTIGIILGNPSSAASSYDQEKLCIFEPMAVELQRKNQHVRFHFAYNQHSILGTVKATQDLISQQVDLVLLPLISSQALAAKEILEAHNIPFLTSGTLDRLITDTSMSLSTMPSNQAQVRALAKYAHQYFKQVTFLTLTDIADPYSTSMSSAFSAELYQLNPRQKINHYEFVHFDAETAMSATQGIEVIFAPLYNPHIAHLYAALAKRDKKIIILGPDSIGARHEFFSIIGESSEHINLAFIKNWDNVVKGPNKDKFMAIQKTYCAHTAPSFENIYSFDLMKLLESVINSERHLTKANVIARLKRSHYISVLDGEKYQFNDAGFNKKSLYLCEISGKSTILLSKLAGN